MKDILVFAKEILQERLPKDGTFVDFTMGNGHDTLYFANYCSEGHVYAFDVQQMALDNTRKLLDDNGGFDNVTLILDSHHNVDKYVEGEIDAGIFNLGYLPGNGNKNVTTMRETTLPAVEAAMSLMDKNGILLVAVYPGHEEGEMEGAELTKYFAGISRFSYSISQFRLLNSPESPFFMVVESK